MPRSSTGSPQESIVSATAQVLGKNLKTLMKGTPDLNSNPKLSKKTGLSTSTISRLLNGQVEATLVTLGVLGAAFHVEPWQLLVPDIEAGNLPVLMPLSEAERKLHERLRDLAKELRETQ